MREITEDEVQKLKGCLQELAEHHNEVSRNFKGSYPHHSYEITLNLFSASLEEKTSRIAVAEEKGNIIGFCKIDFHNESGKIDYLVVKKEYRKKGYGKKLMDWAMNSFDRCNAHHIEVKVVDGNETIHLYERYGFKINAHILVNNR